MRLKFTPAADIESARNRDEAARRERLQKHHALKWQILEAILAVAAVILTLLPGLTGRATKLYWIQIKYTTDESFNIGLFGSCSVTGR